LAPLRTASHSTRFTTAAIASGYVKSPAESPISTVIPVIVAKA
jgi:hypothetical protein